MTPSPTTTSSSLLHLQTTSRFSVWSPASASSSTGVVKATPAAASAAVATASSSSSASSKTKAAVAAATTTTTTPNKKGTTTTTTPSASTTTTTTTTATATATTSVWNDTLQQQYERIVSVGEECISPVELKDLMQSIAVQNNQKQLPTTTDATSPSPSERRRIILYDGFEPSGRMHIAQGVFKAVNVNKCTIPSISTSLSASQSQAVEDSTELEEEVPATFVFWVADWFALMNDKMGGDLDKIQTVGYYLMEVWKAAGMSLQFVQFLWASQEITMRANIYWPIFLNIASKFTIARIKKCGQIMGRNDDYALTSAQLLYPLMQCTDIFFLKADICQLGLDQRKVNMLAREYCDSNATSTSTTKKSSSSSSSRRNKPIILSHHMLFGLKAGQAKMSKSDPDSAIFMEDTVEDVQRKIMNAYCPRTPAAAVEEVPMTTTNDTTTTTTEGIETKVTSEGVEAVLPATASGTPIDGTNKEGDDNNNSNNNIDDFNSTVLKNPCLDYIRHIILSPPNATFVVGTTTYTEYKTVENDFLAERITENQLKEALIVALNQLLEPVRHHFTHNTYARELLDKVKEYKAQSLNPTTTSEDQSKKTIHRLNLVALTKVAPQSHLVLGPLPNVNPTWQEVMDVLTRLRQCPASVLQQEVTAADHRPIVLLLQDWSAIVLNACTQGVAGADASKAIAAYYKLLLTSLSTLDPVLMSKVQIVYQSEAILADPSNYWISVINVGRHFKLGHVMGGGGLTAADADTNSSTTPPLLEHLSDSDGVGHIVSRLMTVADIVGVEPATLSLAPTNRVEQSMLVEFITTQLSGTVTLPTTITVTNCISIRLQPIRESEAHKTENDEYFILDDPKVHGKSKLNKSFAEERNVDFCPALNLASVFCFGGGGNDESAATGGDQYATAFAAAPGVLQIQRSVENGGDATYTSMKDLIADYRDGKLHPGDLKKTGVIPVMTSLLEKVTAAIKADKVATQASKTLKALHGKKK